MDNSSNDRTFGISTPVSIYLDLNHWYALGETAFGHPVVATNSHVLAMLKNLVERNRLILPLSSVHYMELTENPRDKQRNEAATVMASLSGFRTIAPISRILVEELDRAFNTRFGRPAFPEKVDKFGIGAGFAFGQSIRGRIRGGSEDDRRDLEARTGMSIAEFETEMNLLAEHFLLAGPSQNIGSQIPGYDPYAARRVADQQLASFNVMVQTLRTNKDIGARPLDAIAAREFTFEFLDHWTRAWLKAGFTKDRRPFHSKEEYIEFLMSLPTRRVSTMIRFHYLREVYKDWTINDLRDVAALSLAIPYCDLVVTDKKAWDVTVNRAHLDVEFNTVILPRLSDLLPYLEKIDDN
jgi:hypothetical protein